MAVRVLAEASAAGPSSAGRRLGVGEREKEIMARFAALIAFLASAATLARAVADAQAQAKATTYISGSWYFGLASCGGKPLVPFNFTANLCAPLNTTDLQGQFKGQSLLLTQQDPTKLSAALDVFVDDSCSIQPTRWGVVSDGECYMSYYSTKYTFYTKFTEVS